MPPTATPTILSWFGMRALSTQVQQAGDSVGSGSTPEVQEDESGRGSKGGNGMGPLLGREEEV